jgi:hypothetical protein
MALLPKKSLGHRLAHLEAQLRPASPVAEEPRDEDGWLAVFEELGRDGLFKAEPDFPVALAFYRDALARAHASTDPPFDPPPDFQPHLSSHHLRCQGWRDRFRFPDLDEGFNWLGEMLERVCEGIPPITEAEFRELAEWFAANDARLYQLALPSQLLDLGGGRRTSCTNIRYGLAKGPRADGAGEVAEGVRELHRRYGHE